MSTAPTRDRRRNACPMCRRPGVAAHTPFCSQRCRDRDLLNWLGDGYRVPGLPVEDDPGLDSEA